TLAGQKRASPSYVASTQVILVERRSSRSWHGAEPSRLDALGSWRTSRPDAGRKPWTSFNARDCARPPIRRRPIWCVGPRLDWQGSALKRPPSGRPRPSDAPRPNGERKRNDRPKPDVKPKP